MVDRTRVPSIDLGQLRGQLEQALEPLLCTTPARGVPWLDHCAACCYGTGFAVSSEEEARLAEALNEAINAIGRYLDADSDHCENPGCPQHGEVGVIPVGENPAQDDPMCEGSSPDAGGTDG